MKNRVISTCAIAAACAAFAAPAGAATQVVTEADVTRQAHGTPSPSSGWVVFNRGADSTATFREGPGTPPLGTGSLELATGDKVYAFNFDHRGKKLSDVDAIEYSTNRSTFLDPEETAALNLGVDPDGAGPEGFTTLVFEPHYTTPFPVISGQWQKWDADGAGVWWSTKPINGQCAGATADCDKTWSEVVANNPDAVIAGGVGVNQGGGNPGLTSAVDALTFDETTYDFEKTLPDTDADDDGVEDIADNCVDVANPGQADLDADGKGDACDGDRDGDEFANEADNCADVFNADQADADGDGVGTACETSAERPSVKDDCKDAGFRAYTAGKSKVAAFKNQGECVAFVNARNRS